jgi:spore maturation protein CgeB
LRSYNICVLSANEADCVHQHLNFYRALTRMGNHSVSQIGYREIYKQHGPRVAVKMIDGELRKINPEIILIALDYNYEFPIEYFSGLRQRYFVIAQAGEDEHYFDKHSRYYAQGFDLVCTTSRPNAMRFELYGVDTAVFGALLDLQNFEKVSYEKIYDVGFVGNIYGKVGREDYIKCLLKEGINASIFGSGTLGGMVSNDEMNRTYGSSKIGLSFTGVSYDTCLDNNITINRRCRQIKGRSHEIALTGTFVLSEYAPGIEDEFEIGKEIEVFHGKEDLLAKIKYYLDNDSAREKIALNGHSRVLRDYDETKGWKKLMDVIDAKVEIKHTFPKNSNFTIYKDPIFKRAFSSFHLYKMLEFFLKGMPKAAWHEFMIYVKYPWIDGGVFLWNVKNYTLGFLGNFKCLRKLVRNFKKLVVKNHADKI